MEADWREKASPVSRTNKLSMSAKPFTPVAPVVAQIGLPPKATKSMEEEGEPDGDCQDQAVVTEPLHSSAVVEQETIAEISPCLLASSALILSPAGSEPPHSPVVSVGTERTVPGHLPEWQRACIQRRYRKDPTCAPWIERDPLDGDPIDWDCKWISEENRPLTVPKRAPHPIKSIWAPCNGDLISAGVFKARIADELDLHPGDWVEMCGGESENWWKGKLDDGRVGFVPREWLEEEERHCNNGSMGVDVSQSSDVSQGSDDFIQVTWDCDWGGKDPPPRTLPERYENPKPYEDAPVGMNLVSKGVFIARTGDELSLERYSTVQVVGAESETWWKGVLDGTVGYFPRDWLYLACIGGKD